jgi:hypothetical protein
MAVYGMREAKLKLLQSFSTNAAVLIISFSYDLYLA